MAPASAAVVDVGSKPFRYETHLADLSGDVLGECVDVTSEVLPPLDAGAGWQPLDPTRDAFSKKLTTLARPCAEQFADRKPLAVCDAEVLDAEKKTGARIHLSVRSAYYNYADVGVDDQFMKECLESKGKWTAIPRDSAAWKHAKLEHAQRELQKLGKKYQAAQAEEP